MTYIFFVKKQLIITKQFFITSRVKQCRAQLYLGRRKVTALFIRAGHIPTNIHSSNDPRYHVNSLKAYY
jgi:hypothetical protein